MSGVKYVMRVWIFFLLNVAPCCSTLSTINYVVEAIDQRDAVKLE